MSVWRSARAVGALAWRQLKRIRPKPRTVLRAALLAPVVLFFATMAWIMVDGLTDELRPAEVGIVLSSRVLRSGQPAASLEARLDRTAELYEQGYFPRVIVSGGIGRSGYDEAEVMRNYLVRQGIPKEAIHVDNSGENTYETARSAAQYMEQNSLTTSMLVSQYFHLTRAKIAARRFGIPVVYAAHARYWDARNDPWSVLREIVGVYAYLLRSYP